MTDAKYKAFYEKWKKQNRRLDAAMLICIGSVIFLSGMGQLIYAIWAAK